MQATYRLWQKVSNKKNFMNGLFSKQMIAPVSKEYTYRLQVLVENYTVNAVKCLLNGVLNLNLRAVKYCAVTFHVMW